MHGDRINCYQNDRGDFLIVPMARQGYGGVFVNRPTRLPNGTRPEELGEVVKNARQYCDLAYYDPTVGSPAVTAAGEKSPRTFAKKWRLVVVCFDDLVEVLPTSRDFKGNYWYLYKDPVKVLENTNEGIGLAILQAYAACRLGPRFDGIY